MCPLHLHLPANDMTVAMLCMLCMLQDPLLRTAVLAVEDEAAAAELAGRVQAALAQLAAAIQVGSRPCVRSKEGLQRQFTPVQPPFVPGSIGSPPLS